MRYRTVRISDDKVKIAKKMALKEDRSMRWIIDKAIELFAKQAKIK